MFLTDYKERNFGNILTASQGRKITLLIDFQLNMKCCRGDSTKCLIHLSAAAVLKIVVREPYASLFIR